MSCGNARPAGRRGGAAGILGKAVRCVSAVALAGLLMPSAAYAAGPGGQEEAAEAEEAAEEGAEEGGGVLEALSGLVAQASFGLAGSGTEADPYVIDSAGDFEDFVTAVNSDDSGTYRGACYELSCDVDASALESAYRVPVGTASCPFTGSFDGGGHSVTVDIAGSGGDYVGLFGYVSNADIEDLTVKGSVTGGDAAEGLASTVGGVVGYAYASSSSGVTLKNLTNEATVVNTYTKGSSSGIPADTGGIVGFVRCQAGSCTVEACANTGSVSSTGGSPGSVMNWYYANAGGILGGSYSTNSASSVLDVSQCLNTGDVTTNYFVAGGVAGYCYAYNSGSTTNSETNFTDCYNRGGVSVTYSGSSYATAVGGILGVTAGATAGKTCWKSYTFANNYNAGTLSNAGTAADITSTYTDGSGGNENSETYTVHLVKTGAIVGRSCVQNSSISNSNELPTGNVSNNYYLDGCGAEYAICGGDTTTAVNPTENIGSTEDVAEAVSEETFKSAGFSARLGTNYADDTGETYNAGWPYLRWQNPSLLLAGNIVVDLADDANDDEDELISLAIVDSSGADASGSVTGTATHSSASWTGDFADGTYAYTVSKRGYETVTGTLEIDGAGASVAIDLEPTGYSYTITVSPSDADVVLTNAETDDEGGTETAEVAADGTATDEAAGTATYTYTGLHNDDELSYSVSKAGYVSQSGDVDIDFADASDVVTLAAKSSRDVTVAVDASSSGSGEAPTVVIYYALPSDVDGSAEDTAGDAALDGTVAYDSREDGGAPESAADGTWSFGAGALYEGAYQYVVYIPGCASETGYFAVSDSAVELAVAPEPDESAWDGSSTDTSWYCLSEEGADEYRIYTAAELAALSAIVGGGAEDFAGNAVETDTFVGKTVLLCADVDLGGDEGAYWTPIGGYSTSTETDPDDEDYPENSFGGTFDGQGHTISDMLVGDAEADGDGESAGLTQNRLHSQRAAAALFSSVYGYVDGSTSEPVYAELRDFAVEGADVSKDAAQQVETTDGGGNTTTDTGNYAAAVVARASLASISGVDVVGGSVDGGDLKYVGGVVGYGYSTSISDCSSGAEVSSDTYYVGGVVGYLGGTAVYAPTVEGCSNSGDVSSAAEDPTGSTAYGVGGVVGVVGVTYATVCGCWNTGDVSATAYAVGGVVGTNGSNYTNIYSCYNTGDVDNTATSGSASYGVRAGGIAGTVSSGTSSVKWGTLSDCYSAGAVSCSGVGSGSSVPTAVGGIAGAVGTTAGTGVSQMASMANNYYASDAEGAPSAGVGASIGSKANNITSGYADLDLTGEGYQAVTSEVMQSDDFAGEGYFPALSVSGGSGTHAYTLEIECEYETDYPGANALNGGYPILEGQLVTDFSEAEVSADNQLYTGEALEPAVTVTILGKELSEGSDYTVEYADNVELGTATVTVTGAGAYAGDEGEPNTATGSFGIVDKSIESATVTLGTTEYVYDGSAKEPEVTVTLDGTVLTEGTDYKVSYGDNVDAGTATVTVTGIGDYAGTLISTYTINAASIESATIADIEDQAYTGSAIEPELTVTFGEGDDAVELVAGVDYTVSFSDNTALGTATITVTGTGNYTGTLSTTFTIAVDLSSDSTVIAAIADQTYTGSAITPELTVSIGDLSLTEGTDYTVTYTDNVHVGTVTVTLTGIGSCGGTATTTFNIVAAEVAVPTAATGLIYNGSEQTGVAADETGLYTVTDGSATAAGTYTAKASLTDKDSYVWATTGTSDDVSVEYTIAARSITDAATVALDSDTGTYTYTGSAIEPAATVTLDGTALVAATGFDEDGNAVAVDDDGNVVDADYSVTYSDNVAVGIATVVVTGTGNYTGSVSTTFTIVAKSIEGATVTFDSDTGAYDSDTGTYTCTYTGSDIVPTATVTLDGTTLTLAKEFDDDGNALDGDYSVTYSDNIAAGTATVTVTGAGNYTGTATATFTIAAADASSATVTLDATSYVYDGSAKTPVATVMLGSTTLEPATEFDDDGNAVNGDYSVTYSDNIAAGTGTVTVAFAGNYTGTATATFTIAAAEVAVPTAATGLIYNGSEQTGVAADETGLYTVTDGSATAAGTYTATATLVDTANYAWADSADTDGDGSVSVEYTIESADASSATVTLDATSYVYDGSAKTPEATVTLDGATFAEGADYTVEYAGNTGAGAGTVTVTFAGNYTGTATASFTIEPLALTAENTTVSEIAEQALPSDGSAVEPEAAVTVTIDGAQVELVEGTDYTLAYGGNNVAGIGTGSVTVYGAGNYTSEIDEDGNAQGVTAYFDIYDADAEEALQAAIDSAGEIEASTGDDQVVQAAAADVASAVEAAEEALAANDVEGIEEAQAALESAVADYESAVELSEAADAAASLYEAVGESALVDSDALSAYSSAIESAESVLSGSEVSEVSDAADALAKATETVSGAVASAAQAAYDSVSTDAASDSSVSASMGELSSAIAALTSAIESGDASAIAEAVSSVSKAASATTSAVSSYEAAVKAAASGSGSSSSGAKKASKKSQKMKVTKRNKTVKYKKLKKKAQKVKAITVKNYKGKLSFKKVSGSKRLSLVKGGRIKVKKGTKKGTYKIKVKVTAKGNSTYKSASKTVTVKIKVK